jgi:hypothetical protein
MCYRIFVPALGGIETAITSAQRGGERTEQVQVLVEWLGGGRRAAAAAGWLAWRWAPAVAAGLRALGYLDLRHAIEMELGCLSR